MPTSNSPLVTFATTSDADAERIRCVLAAMNYAPRRLMPETTRLAYALPLFAREYGLKTSEEDYLSAALGVRGTALNTPASKLAARFVRVRCGLGPGAPLAELHAVVSAYVDTVTTPAVPAGSLRSWAPEVPA